MCEPPPVLYYNNLPSLIFFQTMGLLGLYVVESISETIANALASLAFR